MIGDTTPLYEQIDELKDELAALKAQEEHLQQLLKSAEQENEQLKETLNDVYLLLIGPGDNNEVMNMSVEIIESIRSKHETK